jgi:CDP-glucose 4,6-dehydratase
VAIGEGSVEGVELTQFSDSYRGRRVLLTGHTGFKGSWLALWLTHLGADVVGVSLAPPTSPNHWDLLRLGITEHRLDIRDASAVAEAVSRAQPEIVFHLAAQSLVRRSYRDPLETWSTNVVGTANLLEACRQVPNLRAIVIVTSDKCYENREEARSHCETDRLGGRDPYSASKAAAELVAASYRHAFFDRASTPLLATARAGNVIGGGDWSEDRLIPDLVRAVAAGSKLEMRSPNATRPWQHVLESLSGYILLGQKLLEGERACAGAWNFGPRPDDNCTVAEVLTRMRTFWPTLAWHLTAQLEPREAQHLSLDSSKAREELGWRPVWSLDAALGATTEWYRRYLDQGRVESRSQLGEYVLHARDAGLEWAAG